jgi:hypothetical protein
MSIHPDFALQLHGKLLTLKERFEWKLADVTRELEEGVYHAPGNAKLAVTNFISSVTNRYTDIIARGDVEAFNRLCTELELALRPLKYLPNERPLNHNHASGD